jgi:hypothetical protein
VALARGLTVEQVLSARMREPEEAAPAAQPPIPSGAQADELTEGSPVATAQEEAGETGEQPAEREQ